MLIVVRIGMHTNFEMSNVHKTRWWFYLNNPALFLLVQLK